MSSSRQSYGDPHTRGRILAATKALLTERGDVSLADVARAAGVSRQTVYLHFRDRGGLLLALVHHMDEELGLADALAQVFAASTGVEAMERAVVVHSWFNPAIDPVARVLETAKGSDPLAQAWRERLTFRRGVHRDIVERIAEEGSLARGWSIEPATDLFFTVTLPAAWRELTEQLSWTERDYVEGMTRMLRNAFVRGPEPNRTA